MKDFMTLESKPFRILSRAWDLIVLNLLLLVCSLPVVTAGAAVTAVYDMSLRMLRDEEGYIVRGFLKAFRSNFKQATLLWLGCLGVFAVSIGDYFAGVYLADYGFQPVLTVIAGVQLVLLLAIMQYSFALTARFENSCLGTLKNSILLVLCHLPETAVMVCISVSAAAVLIFVPIPAKLFSCVVTMCLILWFALGIYLNGMLLSRIFQKHFGSEKEKEPEEAEEEAALQLMYNIDGYTGGK